MLKMNSYFKLKKTIIVFNYTLPYPYNCQKSVDFWLPSINLVC